MPNWCASISSSSPRLKPPPKPRSLRQRVGRRFALLRRLRLARNQHVPWPLPPQRPRQAQLHQHHRARWPQELCLRGPPQHRRQRRARQYRPPQPLRPQPRLPRPLQLLRPRLIHRSRNQRHLGQLPQQAQCPVLQHLGPRRQRQQVRDPACLCANNRSDSPAHNARQQPVQQERSRRTKVHRVRTDSLARHKASVRLSGPVKVNFNRVREALRKVIARQAALLAPEARLVLADRRAQVARLSVSRSAPEEAGPAARRKLQ
jgi:hypothetical protein